MILETIYTILAARSPLLAGGRIFPSVVPQGQTFPAIVYQRDSSRFLRTFDGHNAFTRTGVQVDCYAKTVLAAAQLAASVKSTLIDYAARPINLIALNNEFDLFEPDTELHRVLLQFSVWHLEE